MAFKLQDIPDVVIIFGLIAITLGMVTLALAGMQNQTDASSDAYTILGEGIDAVGVFSDWQSTLAIIIVTVIIIGLILSAFYFGKGKGGGL